MNIFIPEQEEYRDVKPIDMPEWGNISVVPYVKGRLVFADIVAKLLSRGTYDRVLIDFPASMDEDREWLSIPLLMLPTPQVLMITRNDGSYRAIPFVPNDAACAAARVCLDRSIPFECIDDPDLVNYPKEGFLSQGEGPKNDYRVWRDGLEALFHSLQSGFEEEWGSIGPEARFFSKYRAHLMAGKIRDALQKDRLILLVCEYRLFWTILQVFDQHMHDIRYLFKGKKAPAILRFLDPCTAWAERLLDDYPSVTLDFWNALKNGEIESFRKQASLEKTIRSAVTGRGQKEEGKMSDFSIRRITAFQRYLRKITHDSGNHIPEPEHELFHAVQACGDRRMFHDLARALLDYSHVLNDEQRLFLSENEGLFGFPESDQAGMGYDDLLLCFNGRPLSGYGNSCEKGRRAEEREVRLFIADHARTDVTPEEMKHLRALSTVNHMNWAVQDDYIEHERLCSQARLVSERIEALYVPRRTWGSIEKGIHWPATLVSRAKGESDIYVRHGLKKNRVLNKMNEFTPVVVLFEKDVEIINNSYSSTIYDSNITQRNIDLGNEDFPFDRHPEPDRVLSLYYTGSRSKIEGAIEGNLYRIDLTSITLLYTKHCMGIERYGAINSRERKYQCRLMPDWDDEVNTFPLSERGNAWAAKYAEDTVIVVAHENWLPSERLAEYVRNRGIRIAYVPIGSFSEDFIERTSKLHFISTALKKHPNSPSIIRRFVC